MTTTVCNQAHWLTVHEFTQAYRPAIGLQGIAMYKVIARYHAHNGLASPTQTAIAHELGCARETVNRTLRRLVAAALLTKQSMTVQGRTVVVYRPLIALCDETSQRCDGLSPACADGASSCDRSSPAGVLEAPSRVAQAVPPPPLTSDDSSLLCEPASHGCDVPAPACAPPSPDLEEDDLIISADQERNLQIINTAFVAVHGRALTPDEQTIFGAIVQQEGLAVAEQVLERLRGQRWHSPNYLRAVWQNCRRPARRPDQVERGAISYRNRAGDAAALDATEARLQRYCPAEFADIIRS